MKIDKSKLLILYNTKDVTQSTLGIKRTLIEYGEDNSIIGIKKNGRPIQKEVVELKMNSESEDQIHEYIIRIASFLKMDLETILNGDFQQITLNEYKLDIDSLTKDEYSDQGLVRMLKELMQKDATSESIIIRKFKNEFNTEGEYVIINQENTIYKRTIMHQGN